MSIFFSPSTGGFYHSGVHGDRRIMVPDPEWVRPMVEATIVTEEGSEPAMVPDPDAEHPLVEVDNLDCRVPADAVEISEERHAELLQLQSQGKRIVATAEGTPDAVDPDPMTAEQLWAVVRRRRDGLLAKSDWTQVGDAPLDDEQKAAWRERRQFLRDLTSQKNPAKIDWGADPA